VIEWQIDPCCLCVTHSACTCQPLGAGPSAAAAFNQEPVPHNLIMSWNAAKVLQPSLCSAACSTTFLQMLAVHDPDLMSTQVCRFYNSWSLCACRLAWTCYLTLLYFAPSAPINRCYMLVKSFTVCLVFYFIQLYQVTTAAVTSSATPDTDLSWHWRGDADKRNMCFGSPVLLL